MKIAPDVSSMNSLHEILANAADIIEQSSAEYILFGGDINVNVSKTTPHAHAVNEFLTTYKLIPGHASNNTALAALVSDKPNKPVPLDITKESFYTFSNEKLGRYTVIDYIFVTKNVKDCVSIYKTLESESNYSDHLCVYMSLNVPLNFDIDEFVSNGKLGQSNAADEINNNYIMRQRREIPIHM